MIRKDDGNQLVVRLLGDPEVRRGAEPIEGLQSARLRTILAYLIVHRGRPVTRQRLAYEFWPESTESQARTNVRQALHHLRRALDDADRYLRVSAESVEWLADNPASVDLADFEAAAAAGLAAREEHELRRAADLYQGDLLASCYDEWVVDERRRVRTRAADVLVALASIVQQRCDWAEVIEIGDRLLRMDPTDEAAHRLVIAAHASSGDPVRALRRYHECVTVLHATLAVAPNPLTVALHDELIAGRDGSTPAELVAGADRLPLVGRDDELRSLVHAWDPSSSNRSSFVLVTGEPGIGKSRLVAEVAAVCRRRGAAIAAARAYEAEGDLPYGPIIDILRSTAVSPGVAALPAERRQTLLRVLPDQRHLRDHADPTSRPVERRRIFEAVAELLVARCPLVVAIDDLHWCDPDTFDLLEFVLRTASATSSALLVVGTIRDEELASDPALRPRVSRLHQASGSTLRVSLGRLGAAAARDLVAQIAPAENAASVDRVISAAAGNPLFLVEMARSGLLGGPDGTSATELPPRVQAVIEARLERLSNLAREIVGLAAVVGRAFTIDLIGRLLGDQRDAVAAIDELWRRGIVREHGTDSYDFSHDRIRDVAEQRLGPARRSAHHTMIAEALRSLGVAEPGRIAYHFDRAGRIDDAIAAYRLAVDASVRAFAHHDVIAGCRRALSLIATRPSGPRRDESELAFLVPLGVALMAGPGVTSADIPVYERARTLRTRRGLDADPSTLRLSANAAISRREYHTARRFGETLLQRGLEQRDSVLTTEGHYLVGVTSFWLGDLHRSRLHLDDALAAHDLRNTAVHLERFGQDPRAVCLVRLALTAFELGDEVAAAAGCTRALEAAAELGHEYTEVYVRMFAAWFLAESDRPAAAAEVVRSSPATPRHPMAVLAGAQFDGWERTVHGDPVAGARLLRRAQQIAHHHGPQMFEPYILMMLARAQLAAGHLAQAARDAAEGLVIATTEMPFHIPEATRLVGELEIAAGGDLRRARDRLVAAEEVAIGFGAVVHECRARTSLTALDER